MKRVPTRIALAAALAALHLGAAHAQTTPASGAIADRNPLRLRDSAYEKLKGRAVASGGSAPATTPTPGAGTAAGMPTPTAGPAADAGGGLLGGLKDVLFGSTGPRGGKHEGLAESAARSAVRSIGSSVGREIIRGVLGSILGGGRRR